ncbi:MAG: penicillin-binding protein 2 [Acidimicrobiales bacterium]
MRAGDIEGVTIEDEFVRSNPNDDLALGVIGRSLADGQTDEDGRSGGISGSRPPTTASSRASPGSLLRQQDVDGDPIAGGHRALEPAKQGGPLPHPRRDAAVRGGALHLRRGHLLGSVRRAGAVIMRPSTGEILAMASVAVDGDGEVHVTRDNKPVTSVFEPGSVNKMITIAGAIEDGVVSPDTYVNVPDHLQIYDADFHDSHPHPTADWTTTEILYTSSNIGTIKIARMLGAERVDAYLRSFGFGATTGLGFPAEEDGIMKDLDDWSGVDIGSMPIGQGISVTALQMLSAYNVIANDGIYVAPKLVSSVDRGSGPVPTEPSAGRRVVSADTAGKVRAMLAKVVSEGTGTKAQVPGYVPAGKTGTARAAQGGDGEDGYLDENGNYRYDASFVGMIDGADLSILVTVHDPKTSIFGGDIAAPVFSHLAATALRRYQIPPPELLDAAAHDVPEVSASAREVDGEDVSAGAASGQG